MEEHFLSEYVEGEAEFRPEPWYNVDGDCVVFQIANEAIVADRIDEFLTVYRSAIDDRPIGFQIKGVRAIIKRFGLDGLAVYAQGSKDQITAISIAVILFAAYEQGPLTLRRRGAYAATTALSSERAPEIPVEELYAL